MEHYAYAKPREKLSPMKKTRILLCGFGQIGRMLYRTLLRRPEFELAGVIDLAPELTGADAGTVAGCPPCGIAVSTSPEGIAADVAAVTTVSRIALRLPPVMLKVLFPISESPDMLWYKITFQVQSFWERSCILPV